MGYNPKTAFEWDEGKARSNKYKHGISFVEATEVFASGRWYLWAEDESHSYDELRELATGETGEDRQVIRVVFTVRNHTIRIISARPADREEINEYIEEKQMHVQASEDE